MKWLALRAAAALLVVPLLLSIPDVQAEPNAASLAADADADVFEWAQGRTIDSIYVVGNEKTASFAILREMETREGDRLEPSTIARDQRFLTDLSSFASVTIAVEPVGVDRCDLRVTVTERPVILVKLIYPILEYDFNRNRLRYGVKWNDRNFRRRLENFSLDATRNSDNDDNAAIGWSSPWLGWRQIGVGARVSYFHRNDPSPTRSILEQSRFSGGLSLPLRDSRISSMQLISNLAVTRNRLGAAGTPSDLEVLVSPLIGFRLDARDSRLRPTRGTFFFVSWQSSRVVNGEGSSYFRLSNDVRAFFPLNDYTVLGLYSNLQHQFGAFPDYIRFGMGGSGSLRGYSDGVFRGAHRWIQTAEVRVMPLPQWFFRLPIAGLVDVSAALVFFADGGIVWNDEDDFNSANYRGGGGFGFRVYSPLQDVIRIDFGYNRRGGFHPYVSTGVRF